MESNTHETPAHSVTPEDLAYTIEDALRNLLADPNEFAQYRPGNNVQVKGCYVHVTIADNGDCRWDPPLQFRVLVEEVPA